jgi:hypothetical protein
MKTTEAIMEEINWRVIDNRLREEQRSLHDIGCLEVERDKRRNKLYKLVKPLAMMIPEPKAEEIMDVAGREEPAYRPPPTTQEGLRKQAEGQKQRKEELEVAFALNWATAEPETVERIVDNCWKLEDAGGELWEQCEHLRDLILKGQMPQ